MSAKKKEVEETTAPLMEALGQILQEIALDIENNATDIVADAVPNIVLSALGIEKSKWHDEGFRLGGANGYMGIMGQEIKELAGREARKHAPAIVKKFLKAANKRDREGIASASKFALEIRKRYAEEYRNTLRAEIKDGVQAHLGSLRSAQDDAVRNVIGDVNALFREEEGFITGLMADIKAEAGNEKLAAAVDKSFRKIMGSQLLDADDGPNDDLDDWDDWDYDNDDEKDLMRA